MKVAIQGIKGSFHHIVAKAHFGDELELIECLSFAEMPKLLAEKKADLLVMAIENSIAGAILPNYALIDRYKLSITGEHYLKIQHHLMACPGQKIEDIHEVISHPMALLQCQRFFDQYPHIKLVEDQDTASAAKKIADRQLKGIAAIASSIASELYKLEMLAENIQTIRNNSTRFFVLSNKEIEKNSQVNKASIKFITNNEVGSLASVLSVLAKHRLNLSKIQSMPVIETPWKYAFFADFSFANYQDYCNALQEIKDNVAMLKILGEYIENKQS
jgi:prephenate dehydratase